MNPFTILHILGMLLIVIAGMLLFPLGCAVYYGGDDVRAFLITSQIALFSGFPLWWKFRKHRQFFLKDGFLIVILGWILISSVSALPFMIHGSIPSFTDSFFEVMSGYTTTGASILKDIESLPQGLLFWRSMTHFIGGMGIIILTLLVVPLLGIGNHQLYKVESDPGQENIQLFSRLRQKIIWLWVIYIALNLALTLLMMAGGMSLFDALCHAFGTIATGGYSTKNASMAAYNSAYLDWVVSIFMLLGGTNFIIHYTLLTRNWDYLKSDTEIRYYIGVVVILCLIIAIALWQDRTYPSWWDALRYGSFQVISILTTTGFATANYDFWPDPARMIILVSIFIGACSGSTTSGIRIIQFVIIVKHIRNRIKKLLQPMIIHKIRVNGTTLDDATLNNVLAFFIINLFYVLWGGALLTFLSDMDWWSSWTAVMATFWNIGPGFGRVGPAENFSHISMAGKWFLSFSMMLGRLDIFTVMILFYPSFWKK
ncbi:MAG: TrkH family potassium uptake protein [SAR324 cluster bacterium]|nr:TrkH family potassium uptake protein [SAR324 cluster bacterium]